MSDTEKVRWCERFISYWVALTTMFILVHWINPEGADPALAFLTLLTVGATITYLFALLLRNVYLAGRRKR